jgi:hypothetical protein
MFQQYWVFGLHSKSGIRRKQSIEGQAPATIANDYRQTEGLSGCAPGGTALGYTQPLNY